MAWSVAGRVCAGLSVAPVRGHVGCCAVVRNNAQQTGQGGKTNGLAFYWPADQRWCAVCVDHQCVDASHRANSIPSTAQVHGHARSRSRTRALSLAAALGMRAESIRTTTGRKERVASVRRVRVRVSMRAPVRMSGALLLPVATSDTRCIDARCRSESAPKLSNGQSVCVLATRLLAQ